MSRHKRNSIPDRWDKYSNIGHRIPQTKFICFKVPLEGMIDASVVNKYGSVRRFRVAELIDSVWEREQRELGLVIDLTATDRYYRPELLTGRGMEYEKITCPGAYDKLKNSPPPESVYVDFYRTVIAFESEHADDDLLIGVHCTHGVNRTGYLVCRFMIEEQDYSAEMAIEQFNLARGHELEKIPYLEDLKAKANAKRADIACDTI